MRKTVIILILMLLLSYATTIYLTQNYPEISSNIQRTIGGVFSVSIVVNVGRTQINIGEIQTWSVSGLGANVGYVTTLRWPGYALIIEQGNADSNGRASGSVLITNDVPYGDATIRVELQSDVNTYGEATFKITCLNCQGPGIVHQSQYSTWDIYELNEYNNRKNSIDDMISLFDQAIPKVMQNLGLTVPLPVKVHIISGGCCGGWTGGGEVGFNVGDFDPNAVLCDNPVKFTALDWTRGVIIGEFVNYVTGEGVSGGWPKDWWVDDVWYFPAMNVVQVLNDIVGSSTARIWEQASVGCPEKDYASLPIYVAFKNIKINYGWSAYQNAFTAAKNDQMNWDFIGDQPSALRTNYILAYLRIGANTDITNQFRNAGVSGANISVVQEIINARNLIYQAISQGKDVTKAWQDYRSGNYQRVADDIKETTTSVPSTVSSTILPSTTTTIHTTSTILSTTTTIIRSPFSVSNFGCIPITDAHKCDIHFNNNLNEDAIAMFLYKNQRGRVVSSPASVASTGSGTVYSLFYCSTYGYGTYKVSYKVYKSSDSLLSNAIYWSTPEEEKTMGCS
jgi:hypothetical protein